MVDNKFAVIGAGITGLTVSHQLKKAGISVDLFDRRGEPGGVIKTENQGGWMYEYGPNTLLLKDPQVEDFLSELCLESEMISANPDASNRFIVRDSKLHPLPTSFSGFLKSNLFSTKSKLRLFGEPFLKKTGNDVSLAHFFEHRLGKEILDYIVNPFVAGIHAGRPETLSLKHSFPKLFDLEKESGSILLGAITNMFRNRNNRKTKRRLITFKNGLQQLPKTIFSRLDHTYLNHTVKKIKKTEDGWVLITQMGNYGPYNDLICTIPLHKWNRQLLPLSNQDLDLIKKVVHPPLSIMVLGYKKEQITHPLDGYGFLIPENEKRSVLGALFISSLFGGRAPEGHHLMTVFIGGSRQPHLAKLEGDKILAMVNNDLKDLIGLTGEAVYRDHIYWPNSIPQYHTGYDELIRLFEKMEMQNPGLHIAGNFRGGISVPDCIKNGISLAAKLKINCKNFQAVP